MTQHQQPPPCWRPDLFVSWCQGNSGDNHQHELGAFFETADKWLAFYDDVRAMVVRKQAELRFELPFPAAALRGKTGPTTVCASFIRTSEVFDVRVFVDSKLLLLMVGKEIFPVCMWMDETTVLPVCF